MVFPPIERGAATDVRLDACHGSGNAGDSNHRLSGRVVQRGDTECRGADDTGALHLGIVHHGACGEAYRAARRGTDGERPDGRRVADDVGDVIWRVSPLNTAAK